MDQHLDGLYMTPTIRAQVTGYLQKLEGLPGRRFRSEGSVAFPELIRAPSRQRSTEAEVNWLRPKAALGQRQSGAKAGTDLDIEASTSSGPRTGRQPTEISPLFKTITKAQATFSWRQLRRRFGPCMRPLLKELAQTSISTLPRLIAHGERDSFAG